MLSALKQVIKRKEIDSIVLVLGSWYEFVIHCFVENKSMTLTQDQHFAREDGILLSCPHVGIIIIEIRRYAWSCELSCGH